MKDEALLCERGPLYEVQTRFLSGSKTVIALITAALITIGCSSCGQNSGSDTANHTDLGSSKANMAAAKNYEAAKAAVQATATAQSSAPK